MTAPAQKGETLVVGIGSYTYTGQIVEEADREALGEVDVYKNEDDETCTVVISDKGQQMTLRLLLKDASPFESMAKGDTVTVNAVGYRADVIRRMYSRKGAKAEITVIKEDSMTYS